MQKFRWSKSEGYECSSKGDSRFSALFAEMPDGRTLEMWHQCCVKGYDVGGTNWKLGKGKPPLDKSIDLWEAYLDLWWIWAGYNHHLLVELFYLAIDHGYTLRDRFATSGVNQARALATILNELEEQDVLNNME